MVSSPASPALLAAVIRCLAEHDLEGLMPHGAPPDEYRPEARDFAALLTAGEPVTAEVVARVWAHWFGDGGEAEPTPAMAALAADLQAPPGGLKRPGRARPRQVSAQRAPYRNVGYAGAA